MMLIQRLLLKGKITPENVHREDPKDGLANTSCFRKAVTAGFDLICFLYPYSTYWKENRDAISSS
jgi:hypothetical protein